MASTPGAEQVASPAASELRRETGAWRPCFKPVMVRIAGRRRFGMLRGWLRVADGWLCRVEYMDERGRDGCTEGWFVYDPRNVEPVVPPREASW